MSPERGCGDARMPLRGPQGRLEMFYPQVELWRAQRALRRERVGQVVAKVVVAVMLLGLYWLAFTEMR